MPRSFERILGGVLVASGAFLIVAALGLFRLAKTRPEPWQPTTAIVTNGIYGYTRNPMYLGMALTYAGVAILCDSVVALLLLIPALLVIQYGVIRLEEHYLDGKFGADYRTYMQRVRRWL